MDIEGQEGVGVNILSRIRDRVEECFLKAEQHFNTKIPRAEIKFDLTGTKGGTSCYAKKLLRFNRKLLIQNLQEYIDVVVPHECAHHVTRHIWGYNGIASHGTEWKKVMVEVFHIPPKRCHNMDVSSVARNTKPYQFICGCHGKVWHVGNVARKKLEKNTCICQKCLQRFVYQGKGGLPATKMLTETELD